MTTNFNNFHATLYQLQLFCISYRNAIFCSIANATNKWIYGKRFEINLKIAVLG